MFQYEGERGQKRQNKIRRLLWMAPYRYYDMSFQTAN